ncbi:MAG: ABC-F family ATP-binding cassette domain-containing protein [Clostridia bacterium]|nr:ABC-F family ATP-binding cassette domain-containing protein [Clostridia bacterium]
MGFLIMLISLEGVNFGHTDTHLFENVTFSVSEGERVGLIGPNGEGKTTLINIMLGNLSPDKGAVTKKNGVRVGYLEQNGGYESERTVYEEMLHTLREETDAVKKLSELSEKLAKEKEGTEEYARLTSKIESLHRFIAARDAYNAEIRIKTVLNGMGFEEKYDQKIGTMSGGEKTRLKLCRLLLENPDLLILDEPTNHLDVKTMFWLEDYLSTFKGAIFTVSHDRFFLDRVVTRVLDLQGGELMSFKGNYTKYKELKDEYVRAREKEYSRQQAEMEKLSDYIDRNRVRASTAKSAQSRIKKLDAMEIVKKPPKSAPPPVFKFSYAEEPYEEVLSIKNLTLRAGEKVLVPDVNLSVRRGQKVALIGENGTGKSTLLKRIVGDTNEAVTIGKNVHIAMYDQENANLNPDSTVMSEMWERHVAYSQTEIRSALARSGLFAEDMDKKVSALSGGERAKLALCVFESEHANFLILDEPTNHLDLPARESLEDALKKYPGTVLFVSHDRYFTSALAERVAEIDSGRFSVYEGTYDEYREAKTRENTPSDDKTAAPDKPAAKDTGTHRTARQRAEDAKKLDRMKAVERKIAELEKEDAEINQKFVNPQNAADYALMNSLTARLDTIRRELDALYEEYETYL